MSFQLKTAVAAAALALCSAAQAAPNTISLEFEGVAGMNFDGGQSFNENGFRFTAFDPWGNGFAGFGSGAGSCGAVYVCPSRSSAYYGVVNDGALIMDRTSGGTFSLAGFDLGFIANVFDPMLVGTIGKIVVSGTNANGTTVAEFALEGVNGATGVGEFGHFDFDATFSGSTFNQVSFAVCLDDGMGGCTVFNNFLQGQFGIDGIQVIPEPASLALVGLGLAAAAGIRRRRNA